VVEFEKNGTNEFILDGFGLTLHENIHKWFSIYGNREILISVMKEVTFKMDNTQKTNTDNPFTGKSIVVTGTLENFTRDSINSELIRLGAKVSSAVSKNTDYLIAGKKSGSKLAKAQSLGVRVQSEAEFLQMVK
jgi:DNA ligase (NAD+)